MQAAKDKKPKSKDEDILETARARFKLEQEATNEIRRDALDDMKFLAGDQWPQDVKIERQQDARPMLVINRLPQHIKQVTNDQRQNRPTTTVHPVDDAGDKDTADVYKGILRHIKYNSNADVAYDTSFEGAARKGFGYYRINTAYVHPESFDQEILVQQIHDDFCVHFDPYSQEPDGSDANWCFISEQMPRADFEAEYPDAELCGLKDWDSLGSSVQGWIEQDSVRVAEYFYKEFEMVDLVLLSNGKSIRKSLYEENKADFDAEGISVKNERKARVPTIYWCKTNGFEILEKTVWPGIWIPIIPVYGDKLIVDGKKILEGVIRHSKDSQRMYNYWASAETEAIALAPKAPWLVAEGQIPKGYEAIWKTANTKSHSYLPWKPTDIKGHPVPAPQRNTFEPAVGAITSARLNASEDIKATTGIYDAALGNRSNETSGVAIKNRAQQAQTSNYHLIDNLVRSIRHGDRIIIDLIPKIIDTARAIRIVGEDDEQEVIKVNQEFQRQGQMVTYDLNKGKYDVIVQAGPSFATKREEYAQMMLELAKAAPVLMQSAPDLLVKNFDFQGAQELSDRLKKTLPPGLVEDKDKPPVPPEVQQQLMQQNQMIEALTQQLNAANEEIRTKSLDIQSKEKIEAMKAETDLLKELLKQSQAGARFQVESQLRELEMQQQNLNGSGPQVATANQSMSTGGPSPGTTTGAQ